ncbi:MAG: DMT family transporter, partial [Pseudomonadota bacterium]
RGNPGHFALAESAFLLSIQAPIVRVLTNGAMPPVQIINLSSIIGASILFILLYYKKKTYLIIKTKTIKLHILRAMLEYFAWYLSFSSLLYLQIPIHTALGFCVPIMTSIIATILLKEKTNYHTWLALAIGILGMIIIVKPESFDLESGNNQLIGSMMMLIATFCFATCGILIKKMANHGEKSYIISFYMVMLMSIFSLPLSIYHWHDLNIENIIFTILLALAFIGQQLSVSQAFIKAKLTILMPLTFTTLIPSALIAYVFFNELITIKTIIGVCFIIFGALYSIKYKAVH